MLSFTGFGCSLTNLKKLMYVDSDALKLQYMIDNKNGIRGTQQNIILTYLLP